MNRIELFNFWKKIRPKFEHIYVVEFIGQMPI